MHMSFFVAFIDTSCVWRARKLKNINLLNTGNRFLLFEYSTNSRIFSQTTTNMAKNTNLCRHLFDYCIISSIELFKPIRFIIFPVRNSRFACLFPWFYITYLYIFSLIQKHLPFKSGLNRVVLMMAFATVVQFKYQIG